MRLRTLVLIAVICAFAIPTAIFAAHPAKPGKWEMTTEIDMPGMPIKMPAVTTAVCITKEDLEKNPESTVPKPRKGREDRKDCKVTDYKVDENTVTWNLKCEGQNPVTGNGKITYSADSFDGWMTMKINDRADMKATYKGKWIGAECDKK